MNSLRIVASILACTAAVPASPQDGDAPQPARSFAFTDAAVAVVETSLPGAHTRVEAESMEG